MRTLDDFLPDYEFSESHQIRIDATPERIDQALRTIAISDLPLARQLWWARRLGRPVGPTHRPLIEGEIGGVVLDDQPQEGIVLGLTGQFWRLRGGQNDPNRPKSSDEFVVYDRADIAKAVIDFRVAPGVLSTETRVHVADPASRRQFRRYWRFIRPFSGLIRILFLRAARRRAEA